MSQAQRISLGYEPRHHQHILHNSLKRFNVIVAHRRLGKTHFAIMELIDQGLRNERKNPQYAYIAPTYGQAKRVAWEILKGYSSSIPGFESNESELRVDIPRPHKGDRVRIFLLGAENPGTIRGIYLDGVLFDEYGEMGPDIWGPVIRPALSDRLGFAIFIGTPKGMNHFYDILQVAKKNQTGDWYHAILPASQTGILPRPELDAAKAVMSEEEYLQEFECDFTASLVGAYYGKEMKAAELENRITIVPYDRAVPVITAWDLGVGDSTAIWFMQQVGKAHHAIDYHEDAGVELSAYARVLKEKPYVYGEHLLPHDAAARDLSTGKSREEILRKLGLRVRVLPRHNFDDGKEAVRRLLRQTWFDAIKCERGINCLKNYEKRWDSKLKIFSSQPLHNWASHGSDAFRAYAMGSRELDVGGREKVLSYAPRRSYNIFGRRK